MRAAYVALPEDERGASSADDSQQPGQDHADTRPEDLEKYGKPIEHPMVRTHPVHGSRAVYFHITKAHAHRGHDARGEPGLHAGSARRG